MPLQFAPGEAFQFDWSEDWVKINGVSTKLQIAHFKLSYSLAFFMRAYLTQSHEMLFDAHYHAFTAFGGIPERGIYDNMKTAVDKVGRGKYRKVNKRFYAMVNHYLYEAEFCNPAAGWEKGQVEKAVQDARHGLWYDTPPFKTLNELNQCLQERCQALLPQSNPLCQPIEVLGYSGLSLFYTTQTLLSRSKSPTQCQITPHLASGLSLMQVS